MDVSHITSSSRSANTTSQLGASRIGEILGAWQAREVRIAGGFPECRELAPEQIEDLYQETSLALLSRPYTSEAHLRNALRQGIRHRALNLHRDQRRRGQILAEHAPVIEQAAQARAERHSPENRLLADQDRLLLSEFLAELNELERRIFALGANGLRYRAAAKQLDIPVNDARAAARSLESKRERFQLLYDTGRLCGYRADAIQALKGGRSSEQAAALARAHLAGCPACRAEPGTNTNHAFTGWVALLAASPQVGPLRRWLLGSGTATKVGALAASLAVALGAVEHLHHTTGPLEHHAQAVAVLPHRRRQQSRKHSTEPLDMSRVGSRPSLNQRITRTSDRPSAPAAQTITAQPSVTQPATVPSTSGARREFGPEQPSPKPESAVTPG